MREQNVILAVDIGTSATKVVLFDEDARQLSVLRRHYPVLSPRSGWSEQDPDQIMQAVVEGMSQALRSAPGGLHLLGVAFSSQLYSILAVTPEGRPLSSSLTWSDTRSAEDAAFFHQQPAAQELYQHTGCPVDAIYPLAKIRWLRRSMQLPANTRFVSIKEYVLFQLTGQWVVDWSIASATGLFDIRNNRWDAAALDLLGLTTSSFSEPVSPRQILRAWRPEIAAKIGLAGDTPLIIGGGDGPLASIGVGSYQSRCVGDQRRNKRGRAHPDSGADRRSWWAAVDLCGG